MKQIVPFIEEIDALLNDVIVASSRNEAGIKSILDGRPSSELRKLIPKTELRNYGVFFTGAKLAEFAISAEFGDSITDQSIIADPTCGGGDLLLACTKFLPKKKSLSETISLWEDRLIGFDLFPEFVRMARQRLLLKAVVTSEDQKSYKRELNAACFPGIQSGSLFDQRVELSSASHILINPPYISMQAPEGCIWARGKVNSAAVFLETCIASAEEGTRIIAILPDVLRSGTRYEKWRNYIQSKTEINQIRLFGRFDDWTDIDVFVLELIVKQGKNSQTFAWNDPEIDILEKVSDKFNISIGSLVDYRDRHEGPVVNFISPREVLPWSTIEHVNNPRAYKGKTVKPPFVVVRRTSRLGDLYRAVGAIIKTEDKLAVENHLIILQPKQSDIESCEELLLILKDPRTNDWLNRTIRCRHLTTKSLADVPWWNKL